MENPASFEKNGVKSKFDPWGFPLRAKSSPLFFKAYFVNAFRGDAKLQSRSHTTPFCPGTRKLIAKMGSNLRLTLVVN